MSFIVSLHLVLHIVAGIITLIAGPIAIFSNRRKKRLHIIAGKAFFWAMNYVCISAIIGYFRHSEQIFFVFLLGISILVYAIILKGVRAIQIMKGSAISRFDFVYTFILGIFGIWMMGMGIFNYVKNPDALAIPILFSVFGLNAMRESWQNFKVFTNQHLYDKLAWLKIHVSAMIGALMASTTAFTVNSAHFLPWYIQWFGPTVLLLPLQIYWSKQLQVKTDKRTILASA